MRVITGTARGRKLSAPEGLDTRPTTEIVKEAVFSIIQFEVEGAAVLDLFAGSGQMGVESLSRGAKSCVFVDKSKVCRAIIEENLVTTGFIDKAQIIGMDAIPYVQNAAGPFDIAFIDPPYGKSYFEKILAPLSKIMSENGIIICETDKFESLPEAAGPLKKYKDYRYGKTKITVYRHSTEE